MCEWHLRLADPQQELVISMEDFHLEREENCAKDSLDILDPVYGYRVCDKTVRPPMRFTSPTHEMLLRFKTDSTNEYSGFYIRYFAHTPSPDPSLADLEELGVAKEDI